MGRQRRLALWEEIVRSNHCIVLGWMDQHSVLSKMTFDGKGHLICYSTTIVACRQRRNTLTRVGIHHPLSIQNTVNHISRKIDRASNNPSHILSLHYISPDEPTVLPGTGYNHTPTFCKLVLQLCVPDGFGGQAHLAHQFFQTPHAANNTTWKKLNVHLFPMMPLC